MRDRNMDVSTVTADAGAATKDRLTMDVSEAASLLGISAAGTYRAVSLGQLPAMRVGNRVLILREPFMRILRGGAQTGAAA